MSFGFGNLLGGLVGAGIGLVTYPIPHTLRALWHYPKTIASSARALFRENRIGPNLKSLIFLASPVAIIAAPVVVLVGSALYGMVVTAGAGATEFFSDKMVNRIVKDNQKASEYIKDVLPRLWDYHPAPLKEGDKPFDIRIGEAIRGLVVGVVTTLVGATLMLLVMIVYSPKLLLRLVVEFFKLLAESFFLAVLIFLIGLPVIALIVCQIPVAAVVVNLGQGCRRGYSSGVSAGLGGMFSDIGHLLEILNEI